QMMPRLVLRGGYGISSYLEGTGANLRLTQNPPFHKDFEEIGTSPSGGTTDDPTYSPGFFYQAANGFPTTNAPVTTFYAWPKDLKPSVTQEFSLTTEYQVARNSTFQVGYVGIIGRHLTDPFWGNQSTAPGLPGPYDNVVGPKGVLKITQTESNSSYNALQAVFRQRLTAGFELTANYTYSKSLTDDIGFYGVSNIGSGQYYQQNAYDMKSEWGPAGSDTRHNVSVTGVYDLPFGRGRQFGANMNRWVDELVGGWKLGGADVYYSGFPVTVSSNAYYSSQVNAFGGAARPNLLRKFVQPNKSIDAFWGTAVQSDFCAHDQPDDGTCIFQEQPDTSFGKLRPGYLRGPSFQNIDMSVSKTFSVWHEQHLDFRANFFNAFNIADYAAPSANVSDGTNFGKISDTINNSRSTQFVLKYVF
ncbi:MAG TPA: TonB-dependent receptor, partial [Acidobacteriaceae bacterium]